LFIASSLSFNNTIVVQYKWVVITTRYWYYLSTHELPIYILSSVRFIVILYIPISEGWIMIKVTSIDFWIIDFKLSKIIFAAPATSTVFQQLQSVIPSCRNGLDFTLNCYFILNVFKINQRQITLIILILPFSITKPILCQLNRMLLPCRYLNHSPNPHFIGNMTLVKLVIPTCMHIPIRRQYNSVFKPCACC